MPLEARPVNEIEYAAVVALLSDMRLCQSAHGRPDATYRVSVRGRSIRHSHELHGGEVTVMPQTKFFALVAQER